MSRGHASGVSDDPRASGALGDPPGRRPTLDRRRRHPPGCGTVSDTLSSEVATPPVASWSWPPWSTVRDGAWDTSYCTSGGGRDQLDQSIHGATTATVATVVRGEALARPGHPEDRCAPGADRGTARGGSSRVAGDLRQPASRPTAYRLGTSFLSDRSGQTVGSAALRIASDGRYCSVTICGHRMQAARPSCRHHRHPERRRHGGNLSVTTGSSWTTLVASRHRMPSKCWQECSAHGAAKRNTSVGATG